MSTAPEREADFDRAARGALQTAPFPTSFKVVLALVGAYRLWPALFATHPEGFTALIQNAAAAANAGMVERSNMLYPLHAEYFYLTRVGVVYLLQLFMRVAGTAGDGTFHALTLVSYVVFAGATLEIAKRRAGIGRWWGFAALLMTPGFTELGFYFNDNVVSTAFGLVGLALLPRDLGGPRHAASSRSSSTGGLAAIVAGCFLGYAVLCRPDAVLLLPFTVGFVYLDQRSWRMRIVVLALVGSGMAVVFALSYLLGGSSVLQSLEVTRVFLGIHTFPRARSDYAGLFLYTFGLPQLALMPIGATLQWRGETEHRWMRRLILVGLPVVLLAYFLSHAQEVRHFYPLVAPFVVIVGARALIWLFTGHNDAIRRFRPWAVAATLALWLAPPLAFLKDGPRLVAGRLWSPVIWRQYQRDVEWNLASADGLASRADAVPEMTVIAAQYDSDHYFQRALWQHGYLPSPVERVFPQCAGGVEVWEKPGHRVFHLRTENAHINQRPLSYTEAIQLQRGFRCPAVLGDGTPVVVTSLFFRTESWLWLLAEKPEALTEQRGYGVSYHWLQRAGLWLSGPERAWWGGSVFSYNRVVDLSREDVARLRDEVDATVRMDMPLVPPYLRSYEGIMGLFVARVAWPSVVEGSKRWRPVPAPVIPLPGPPLVQ